MKKIFKPLDVDVVEKKFIGDGENVPSGWFSNSVDAIAASKAPKAKRGRKPVEAPKEEAKEE